MSQYHEALQISFFVKYELVFRPGAAVVPSGYRLDREVLCWPTGRVQKKYVNNEESLLVEVECETGLAVVPIQSLRCQAYSLLR